MTNRTCNTHAITTKPQQAEAKSTKYHTHPSGILSTLLLNGQVCIGNYYPYYISKMGKQCMPCTSVGYIHYQEMLVAHPQVNRGGDYQVFGVPLYISTFPQTDPCTMYMPFAYSADQLGRGKSTDCTSTVLKGKFCQGNPAPQLRPGFGETMFHYRETTFKPNALGSSTKFLHLLCF